jgi:hypothetical protein
MTGRRIALVALVAVALAACGDDDDTTPVTTTRTVAPATSAAATSTSGAPATTAASTTTAAPATTVAPSSTTTAPAAASWEKVVPGGDCQCALGSEFSYYVHRGDPSKVVLYFEGGGACFTADTCRPDSGTYTSAVDIEAQLAQGANGIFDLNNPKNPLRDWSFVVVPYCTGDVFLGNKTNEYAPDLTVHHVGAVNAKAALDGLVATFPGTEQLLVAGESAGGIPTPLLAGQAHDAMPAASITVLADGSGAYPNLPAINTVLDGAWGVVSAIPPWPENVGLTAETWSIPGLFVDAGKHDPAIVFARHDYAFDRVQSTFLSIAGIDPSTLLNLIDTNDQQIEAQGVQVDSYVAPGSDHTVLHKAGFYTEAVNGVAFVDWVTDLVGGTPVTDVHCQQCTS